MVVVVAFQTCFIVPELKNYHNLTILPSPVIFSMLLRIQYSLHMLNSVRLCRKVYFSKTKRKVEKQLVVVLPTFCTVQFLTCSSCLSDYRVWFSLKTIHRQRDSNDQEHDLLLLLLGRRERASGLYVAAKFASLSNWHPRLSHPCK